LEYLAGLKIEETEAELAGACAEGVQGAGVVQLFVGEGAGVAVDEVAA